MAAHRIPYIATACAAYPQDLYAKFAKARQIRGTRYIHILCPCPPGWGHEPEEMIEIGREAVRSGMFTLCEIEDGRLRLSAPSRGEPTVEMDHYLRGQKRFRDLTDDQVEAIRRGAAESRDWLLSLPRAAD